MKQKFLDYVPITLLSGQGGKGAVHFQSNARSPRGGPDGGDGGDGGDVLLKTSKRLRNLSTFNHSFYKAEDGKSGRGGKRKGAKGENLVLSIPQHTVCYDQNGQLLYPLLQKEENDKPVLLLKGGRGGKGNAFFKSARRQAPRKAQAGKPAQEKKVILEMKWPSHLALIGLKGVGKSQLLAYFHAYLKDQAIKHIVSLKENFAFNYPRLLALNQEKTKNNKVSKLGTYEPLWVVDLPGLDKTTKKYLRQAEKTKKLLFVISLEDQNPFLSYQSLIKILLSYDKEQNTTLLKKPRYLLLKGEKTADNIKKEQAFKEVKKLSFFAESSPKDMQKLFLFLNDVTPAGISSSKRLFYG